MHSGQIAEQLRGLRQCAGDGQGQGRIAVDSGGADAHALTDQIEQSSQSLVEGHEAVMPGRLRAPVPRRWTNDRSLPPPRPSCTGMGYLNEKVAAQVTSASLA
jgi:hypothetical protein